MKIAAIETFVVSLPVRRPHTWAGNFSPPGRGYVVLKLTLEDGTVGWGETQALKDWGGEYNARSGESHETVKTVVHDLLAPVVIGEDVSQIENVHAKMDKFVKGYPYAKAAIDVAMHDAVGKLLGIPVYQLLGGLVRRAIPLAHSIGLMEIDVALAEAQAVVDEGITTLKVKVGVDAARDIELVERLRHTLGPKVKLRVDANQGYRTWKEALRRHPHDPENPFHTFYFHIDDKHVIDGNDGGNAAKWINHACGPNCEADEDEEENRVFIKALRDIEPGEELNYDYGLILEGKVTKKAKKEFACHCGTPECRGTMLAIKKKKKKKKK